MYVTYDFYKDTLGGLIPAEEFPKYETQAEAHLKALTYLNGDIFAEEDSTVKLALCAACDVLYQHDQKVQSGMVSAVKSESNDGYSVSYVAEAQDGQTTEEALRKKVYEAMRLYLLPTGWLSRRLKRCGGGCCDVL